MLIFENPIADGINHLRNIQQRHRGQRRGGGAEWLIAAGGALLRAVGHHGDGLFRVVITFRRAIVGGH